MRDVTRNAMARHSLELIYPLALMIYLRFFCTPVIRWLEVDSKTLCQFTGETDKNGKRIWESDVVWLVYDGKEHIYQIVWDNSELDFKATNGEENYGSNFEYLLCCDEIEVIGNIFDNKELLQEEHK